MPTPDPTFVLDAAFKATLALAAAALAARLLRRGSAASRHLAWTAGVAAALLSPALQTVTPRWEVPLLPRPPANAGRESASAVREPGGPLGTVPPSLANLPNPLHRHASLTAPASGPGDRNLGGPDLWPVLWLLGALTMTWPLLRGALQTLGRRPGATFDSPHWRALVRDVADRLELRRPVLLVRGAAGSMPAAWGLLRPIVSLPAEADGWDEAKRRAVLTHEMAHVKRHDCLTQALAQAACAFYWFHPLAWTAARRLRVERERACDDLVLEAGLSGPDYADHLLQLARGARREPAYPWAVAMARPSQLEGRLLALLDATVTRRPPTRRAVAGVAMGAAALTLALAGLVPWTSPAQAARPIEPAPGPNAAFDDGAETRPDRAPLVPGRAAAASAPAPLPSARPSADARPAPAPASAPSREDEESDDPATRGRGKTKADERVVAALAGALRDADAGVRRQAVASLAQLRAESATGALLQALSDTETEVRAQAAAALGELRAESAVEALAKGLTGDPEAEVRQQAAFALGQIRAKGAVQSLQGALGDAHAEVRQQAAFALGELRAREAVGPLSTALRDTEAEVRQQAAFALGQIRDAQAVPALVEALQDASAEVREQAAFALGELRDPRAIEALTRALKDAEADVRQQAAFALGQLAR